MFSYPPWPWIPTRDNLVSGCTGSPTMPPATGTRLGTETMIIMEYRPWIASRRRSHVVTGPRRRLKPWGGHGGLARTLQSITTESGGGLGKDATSQSTTGTNTSTGAERAKAKADEKVHLLLTEVLQCCDSILETLSAGSGNVRRADGGAIDQATVGRVVLDAAIGAKRGGRDSEILTAAGSSSRKDDPGSGVVVDDDGVLDICT
jgi:hypothetical protein